MNFSKALQIEEKNLINVIDVPVGDITRSGTFVGPTKVWFYLERYKPIESPAERELLARWKTEDLAAYYRQIKQNKYKQDEFNW